MPKVEVRTQSPWPADGCYFCSRVVGQWRRRAVEEAQRFLSGVPSWSCESTIAFAFSQNVSRAPFQLSSPHQMQRPQRPEKRSLSAHVIHRSSLVLFEISLVACPMRHLRHCKSETFQKDHPLHAQSRQCCHPHCLFDSVDQSRLASSEGFQPRHQSWVAAQRTHSKHLFWTDHPAKKYTSLRRSQ